MESTSEHDFYEGDLEEAFDEETHIEWSNLIFLPFHPIFKLAVLFSVIVKSVLGPLQSVYPVVYCWDVMDRAAYLLIIKYFYWYCCDIIYAIDTFLHMVHRQVTDKAMRRPYLPKSALLLLLDVVALVPFFRLIVNIDCPPLQLWPNVVAFTEFILIYRVVEYFELITTHSFWNLLVGFTILFVCTLNCITCFWLLLTEYGLCANCHNGVYDWRSNIKHKLNESSTEFTTYVYATVFVISFTFNEVLDDVKPSASLEFVGISLLVILGYILEIFIVMPKFFAESILRIRRICHSYPYVQMLINETKRRNSHPKAHKNVKNFYDVMWQKRSGIINIPEEMSELPRELRIDIKQDLVWPVFYHSPTLRKTSMPFKRYICEYIVSDFKLPGEKFFSGPHSYSNLYYIKSGIVQILSADEGTTPILSVSSGTIFGDISFFVPPLKRKVIIKCLTYCEVLFLTRDDYLRALHRYPNDRENILELANQRMKHAKTLYTCKQHVRGLDRSEDEGIAWVKRRWWEISDSLENWRKKTTKKYATKWEISPEEAVYHCAKYIGQLVLCTETQLQIKSPFTNVKFPWILGSHSTLVFTWNIIVLITVFFVLIAYPPNLTRPADLIPTWFRFFQIWTDIIYLIDICVSLVTVQQNRPASSVTMVMFARCKTLYFNLDVLATIWTEYFAIAVGKPEFSNAAQCNRLIKIYKLFTDEYTSWNIGRNPTTTVSYRVILTHFCSCYITGYVIYTLTLHLPDITSIYFFGINYCHENLVNVDCDPGTENIIGVAMAWALEKLCIHHLPLKLVDIYIVLCLCLPSFLIAMYCETMYLSSIYLKYREISNYQHFVSHLKEFYKNYKIHKDLLKRLDRYLLCHWKYYRGVNVLYPNVLNNTPYDIFWKVQGEVAQSIISESPAFKDADPALIRELACAAKMLVLPTNSTMFLFGTQCKNVTWIVQGHVKCEYHNEHEEVTTSYYGPGHMVSISSVFLGKVSVNTYTTCTDCEILYLNVQDFFNIIKHYPNEWANFDICINEIAPVFDNMFKSYIIKHIDYQNKLRNRMFDERRSTVFLHKKSIFEVTPEPHFSIPTTDFWSDPSSTFMQCWMLFRAIIVMVSIISASLQGGSGAVVRWQLTTVGAFCDCIAWIDIVIKMFLAYYDERGILITDKQKCAVYYLTRGFVLDIVGALPWYDVIRALVSIYIEEDSAMLINTFCKFAHLHILLGYFDYISDYPTSNFAYIMIFKWQLVAILVIFGASHFLMSYCVNFYFDDQMRLVKIVSLNTCWVPKFFDVQSGDYTETLHMVFAESLNLAHSGQMGINFGRFVVSRNNLGVGVALAIMLLLFWFVTGYSITLLVLNYRGDSLFQHGVAQLRKFLTGERVENALIYRAVAHFSYWWRRTKGINIQHLTNERIGVVFRQDLSYYFFRRTFLALDTLLLGGEVIARQLASVSTQIFMLPGEEIIREMDLISMVFVVHRGRIEISHSGDKIKTLTKGSIFGILNTTQTRPVRISAKADGYADILQMNIKHFQTFINSNVREKISSNPESQMDYMATHTKHFVDDPYDTIQYILRGRKTIKLPWMSQPLEAHRSNWFSRWLHLAWLVEPVISAFLVLVIKTLPSHIVPTLNWFIVISLVFCDFINLIYFLCDLYEIELVIEDKKCVQRYVGLRKFRRWSFYVDVLATIVPLITYVMTISDIHLFRLLRLRHLYDFHRHFCRSFKSKTAPVIMKVVIVLLLLHATSCGWIYVACRTEKFPLEIKDLPGEINSTIDYSQWVLPNQRKGGCARLVKDYIPETETPAFVVPKHWYNDYIISMAYILLILTHTSAETIVSLSIKQIYYELCISFLIYLVDIWLMSIAISFVYTRYRELYQYDFINRNMIIYLKHSGLSPALLKSLKAYTKHLWRRQRGNWLPELAQQAPICLREDLFCALYMHHLQNSPVFGNLPHYFRRQVVARFKRVVMFPGKCIVQEGDMFPCMFFIHEGEVEKWYIDKSGESRFMSVLTTNGYFGTIPGLFPNVFFQFTYYSRTVVDMVYLHLKTWEDLLEGYPDIKQELYVNATQIRKDLNAINFGK